ncbi:MAG TPA: xanthine dehydrogenase family protein subunit M [Thermomicrobiales bacterium]|jgi:carbon-monoxide dehydrogenase medium subunit|nr:xanthine dehydrogenase family protein subunit M [Thermomicrobiales bacterium]
MNPAPFTYHRPGTIAEAITLLTQHEDEAKLIAGGHSLLPVMKLRLAEPAHLIDLTGASDEGLRSVTLDGDTLTIGALVTHRTLERDATIRQAAPLLAETATHVGDRQVRARGTLGGTLAHADPAADYPAAVLAMGGTIVAQGPDGTREIPVEEFFLGLLTTALSPDEIVIAYRIPAAPAGTGVSYQKVANQASGYAIIGVAAQVSGGTVRVGVTGATGTAFRATAVEEALSGGSIDAAAIDAATAGITDGMDLLDDIAASSAYRARLVPGLIKRAVLEAAGRAS